MLFSPVEPWSPRLPRREGLESALLTRLAETGWATLWGPRGAGVSAAARLGAEQLALVRLPDGAGPGDLRDALLLEVGPLTHPPRSEREATERVARELAARAPLDLVLDPVPGSLLPRVHDLVAATPGVRWRVALAEAPRTTEGVLTVPRPSEEVLREWTMRRFPTLPPDRVEQLLRFARGDLRVLRTLGRDTVEQEPVELFEAGGRGHVGSGVAALDALAAFWLEADDARAETLKAACTFEGPFLLEGLKQVADLPPMRVIESAGWLAELDVLESRTCTEGRAWLRLRRGFREAIRRQTPAVDRDRLARAKRDWLWRPPSGDGDGLRAYRDWARSWWDLVGAEAPRGSALDPVRLVRGAIGPRTLMGVPPGPER